MSRQLIDRFRLLIEDRRQDAEVLYDAVKVFLGIEGEFDAVALEASLACVLQRLFKTRK